MSDMVKVPLAHALQSLNTNVNRNANNNAANDMHVLAGGTDFYPSCGDHGIPANVLDLSRVHGLDAIEQTDAGWRIGATVTWTDIINASLPPAFDALKAAAKEVGSIQIQNAATVGGNLCNASPAADGVPPLLSLDASVELASLNATRQMPLTEFIRGPRDTARQADELLVAIHIPSLPPTARSTFFKLGSRRYLVISIAMVSVLLARDDEDCLSDVRIAVGSCSAVAQRLDALEAALQGQSLHTDLVSFVTPAMLAPLKPIGDVRATAEYRLQAAHEIICRALSACVRLLEKTHERS